MLTRFLDRRKTLRRSVILIGAVVGLLAVVTSVAIASAHSSAASPTMAQWHTAIKAKLAELRKLSTQPAKTQYPAIPRGTPCLHPKTKPDGHLRVGVALASRSNSATVQIG